MNREFTIKITKIKHPRTVLLPYGAVKISNKYQIPILVLSIVEVLVLSIVEVLVLSIVEVLKKNKIKDNI